jgi:hypothetical protein
MLEGPIACHGKRMEVDHLHQANCALFQSNRRECLPIRLPIAMIQFASLSLATPPREVPTEEPPSSPLEMPPDEPEPPSPEVPDLPPDGPPEKPPVEMPIEEDRG